MRLKRADNAGKVRGRSGACYSTVAPCEEVRKAPVEAGSVYTLAARPDLIDAAEDLMQAAWPAFMLQDSTAMPRLYTEFPQVQFVFIDDNLGRLTAAGHAIPIAWHEQDDRLPDEGWDWAITQGFEDRAHGRSPTVLCALSISIHPAARGQRLSRRMLAAMRQITVEQGLDRLIAPVRPNHRHLYPLIPLENYLGWRGPGRLAFDPWIRVHQRLGGKISGICPSSMRISGGRAEWRDWTGLEMQSDGEYVIPEGLVPVRYDAYADEGVYFEPNVWMIQPGPRASEPRPH
jgi:GNAT superfamily N-acetyltransferase